MVAQIDEQQLAVVALPMHPSRQTNSLADMFGSEQIAEVSTITVRHYLVVGQSLTDEAGRV